MHQRDPLGVKQVLGEVPVGLDRLPIRGARADGPRAAVVEEKFWGRF